MNYREFAQQMEAYRHRVDEEARELKDGYIALERLAELYRSFDLDERRLADRVLAGWALSDDEATRFDALALIRQFRVRSAAPALRELAARLSENDAPGAPFERELVINMLRELSSPHA